MSRSRSPNFEHGNYFLTTESCRVDPIILRAFVRGMFFQVSSYYTELPRTLLLQPRAGGFRYTKPPVRYELMLPGSGAV